MNLLQVAQSGIPFLQEAVQTGSIVLILGAFLWYFMQQVKEVRNQYEGLRKECETKYVTMFDKLVEIEKKSIQALTESSSSNTHLAEALKELTDKINLL